MNSNIHCTFLHLSCSVFSRDTLKDEIIFWLTIIGMIFIEAFSVKLFLILWDNFVLFCDLFPFFWYFLHLSLSLSLSLTRTTGGCEF